MKTVFRLSILALFAFGMLVPAFAQEADVTITVANRSSSAWVVTNVQGSSGVAETGERNATMTLRVGVRYRIVNEASRGTHPFELVSTNGSDTVLLSQNAEVTGRFEDDEDVDFQEGSRGITFTMTSELMEALDAYRCGVHPRTMRGMIRSPEDAAQES